MYIKKKVLLLGVIALLILVFLMGGFALRNRMPTPNAGPAPMPFPKKPLPGQPATSTPKSDTLAAISSKDLSLSSWPPIIDAHAHLTGGSPSEQTAYVDQLVAEMDRLGIVKTTLEGMSLPRSPNLDKDILTACKRYPDRFYPYLSGFDPQDEGAVEYVRKQLETGKWRGLGEIILRHSQADKRYSADHPVMLKIYDLCAEYHVPIHVHFEPNAGIDNEQGIEEIKRALAHNPNTIFIWAHSCCGNMRLLDEFPNLYTEGYYGRRIQPNETLADRLLVGTDVGLPGVVLCGGGNYAEGVTRIRELLASLDQTTGEKLAFRNIATLMKDELLVQDLSKRRPPTPTPLPVSNISYTPPPPRPDTPFVNKKETGILFQDDFEDGRTDGWQMMDNPWQVVREDGNYVLAGYSQSFTTTLANAWTDYTAEARFKITAGTFIFNFRYSQPPGVGRNGYDLAISQDIMGLYKHIDQDFFDLTNNRVNVESGKWHQVRIALDGTNIKVYLDGQLKMDYTDDELPLRSGGIAFGTPQDSHVLLDNVTVNGVKVVQRSEWVKTGGPRGGMGYDVRIHPVDHNVMFVTDNPSGVNKSYDGGNNWVQRNSGITSRTGGSMDGIPIFCLTMDPNNPNIVWTGTQSMRGIYKSTDGGETWTKKDNGVTEFWDITLRGFAVRPGDSNTVFAGAEIETGIRGFEHNRVKGKIYKTTDGGENWRCVWEGTSLARIVIFNPQNPDIMYASTGIFDREAYNDTPVGVLKSTDGGETWKQINNGISNLFIGFLEMHPTNPEVLFAAAGNVGLGRSKGVPGAIYRTTDGGQNWKEVLRSTPEWFSVVIISPSNPKIVYAAGGGAFYRSDDGGDHWQRFQNWGLPGMYHGQPIGGVVSPDDPMLVFINSYSGANFKTTDGGRTWVDASKGYTGADLRGIVMQPGNSNLVYAVGRGGIARSRNGGRDWEEIAFGPALTPEWYAIAMNPKNTLELLATHDRSARIFRSIDGGNSWKVVFTHPEADENRVIEKGHGFKALAYSPSNPKVVYAGMVKFKGPGEVGEGNSFGVYKSTDGGVSWVPKNSGLEKSTKNINCIVVHPLNPDIAYIGTAHDGAFKTTDDGESWVAVNNGLMSPDVRSLAIDPKEPETIYAGLGEGAGIYKTTSGGKLWEGINYGIRVECPSYLQRVGQVMPGVSLVKPKRLVGADYYSQPWTSIRSIVIDPIKPEIIYAADFYLGVYMSTDGGKSWVAINQGLFNKAVANLALSSDGRVLYAATSGQGVFKLELW